MSDGIDKIWRHAMRRRSIRGQASGGKDDLWRERTREWSRNARSRRRKEDIWKFGPTCGRSTSGKRLLEYTVLDAQGVIGTVGRLSVEDPVACAKNGVLGELPGYADPGSKVVLIDVQC